MEEIRVVTEAEAHAAAAQMHQAAVGECDRLKARQDRFLAWCRTFFPQHSMEYCQGSTLLMDNFLLYESEQEAEHG